MELCENELAALKTYFQQCGLQLPNENLVVVIKNRQDSVAEREKQLSEIKRNKEKWQSIYEKYKEKYPLSVNEFSTPGAHSTPNIVEPSLRKMNEKSSQTSMVRKTAKSTQVETNKSSKECQLTQTAPDQGTLNSKLSQEFPEIYQNQSEAAESFEFIAGSLKQPQERKTSSTESSKQSEISKEKENNSEMQTKHDDISNFDDSLKVAIALLNSLLESRYMKPELKRNLAGKVIQKIVQIQTSRSIQTSTLSSGIYPLSNSSAPSEAVKSVKEAKRKDSRSSSSKSQDSSSKRDEVLKACFKPMTLSEANFQHSADEEPTKGSSRDQPKSQLMDYVKREKQSHLKRIEMEIEHLQNLRDLLKRNDTPISIEEGQPIYENLSLLLKKSKEDDESERKAKGAKLSGKIQPGVNVWNSNLINKKTANDRSKLVTPEASSQHGESLESFIDKKNRKFKEKYEKRSKFLDEEHVYTRPYSGNKKQAITRDIKSKPGSRKTSATATKDVQTSTSLASSVFESSDSISLPVSTNTKSTTHQSETFQKKSGSHRIKLKIAETQTTDSICRTKPIFEAGNANFGTTSTTVTQRVNRIKNDKQQQTNAPSIRYTLTFDKTSRANIRSYLSLPQRGNSDYANSKISKEIYNHISSSGTLDNRIEDKENYNSDAVLEDEDEIDLQSCLNQNRPDIFTKFEERKRCIAELKKLRLDKIFFLAIFS